MSTRAATRVEEFLKGLPVTYIGHNNNLYSAKFTDGSKSDVGLPTLTVREKESGALVKELVFNSYKATWFYQVLTIDGAMRNGR